MPTTKITAAFAAAPPPVPGGKAKIDFYCEQCPGLLLEVRASGHRTYYAVYRDSRGTKRQMRVGSAAEVTLAQARKRVQEIRSSAALGGDPAAERDRARPGATGRARSRLRRIRRPHPRPRQVPQAIVARR